MFCARQRMFHVKQPSQVFAYGLDKANAGTEKKL